MKLATIGARLTLWYMGIMSAAMVVFGAGIWIALDHSLYHAIDESLRDRVEGIRQFIETEGVSLAIEEMREEFREHSVLGPGGDLFQVMDQDGHWLYRSDPLYDEHVPLYSTGALEAEPRLENVVVQGAPLRFLSQNIAVQGRRYAVQVAAPLRELERGLRELFWVAIPALPLVLLAASAGGYWLSRRALRPVDAITETARSLSARDLSRRLEVPRTEDELTRLSRTLNDLIARLESAFRQIARFTADASHELRTPLAVMRTTAEVALRSPAGVAEQRDALERIVAEIEHASQLVDNLLLIAKADSGEATLKRAAVDLAATVRDACSPVTVLARAKGVAIGVTLPEEKAIVDGDADALRRLFLLLLDNAVKYTPAGGRIDVSVDVAGKMAIATVKDTGIGISQSDLRLIFDRFYRVDQARSREQGGTGLGLAIARWIVEAHGGTIAVESRLGEGSVFTVRLPLRTEVAVAAVSARAEERQS
jgi:heavy metal sensor kinase